METAIPTVYESLSGNQELNASREPATIDPKMLGVSVFKVVSETLYPRHQYNMSESTQISLYAYNKQATIGPNLESAPNCLFAFFSPPLSNVKWYVCVLFSRSLLRYTSNEPFNSNTKIPYSGKHGDVLEICQKRKQ